MFKSLGSWCVRPPNTLVDDNTELTAPERYGKVGQMQTRSLCFGGKRPRAIYNFAGLVTVVHERAGALVIKHLAPHKAITLATANAHSMHKVGTKMGTLLLLSS